MFQPKMTKEVAEKVTRINVAERGLLDDKIKLMKQLGVFSWDEINARVMKFFMEERHVNA